MNALQMTSSNFQAKIQHLGKTEFTGRLDVLSSQAWSFFFYSGRLTWATGGVVASNRFFRIWKQHCDGIPCPEPSLAASDRPDRQRYHQLVAASKNQQLTPQQFKAVVMTTLEEIIFDVLQQEEQTPMQYALDPLDAIEASGTLNIALIHYEQAIAAAQTALQAWRASGVGGYSPNSVFSLKQPEALANTVSAKTYQVMMRVIDGQRSLRDLAVVMNRDVISLTRSLLPYVQAGAIALKQPKEHQPITVATPPRSPRKATLRPLIACVDDSPNVCKNMQWVTENAGYRFLGIQDAVQALPELVEHKPALIFLDFVMPVVNGSEICAQLRRMSLFQDTPIILFTGSQGMITQIKARLIGATDLLVKPLSASQILQVIERHLTPKEPAPKAPSRSPSPMANIQAYVREKQSQITLSSAIEPTM